jgi:hypothetical protein
VRAGHCFQSGRTAWRFHVRVAGLGRGAPIQRLSSHVGPLASELRTAPYPLTPTAQHCTLALTLTRRVLSSRHAAPPVDCKGKGGAMRPRAARATPPALPCPCPPAPRPRRPPLHRRPAPQPAPRFPPRSAQPPSRRRARCPPPPRPAPPPRPPPPPCRPQPVCIDRRTGGKCHLTDRQLLEQTAWEPDTRHQARLRGTLRPRQGTATGAIVTLATPTKPTW